MLTPKIASYPQKPTEGVSTWNNGCADGRGRLIARRCQRERGSEDVANSLNNWKNERHDGDNSSAWPYSLHVFFTVWARRLIAAMRPQAAACWPQACTATMRSASLRGLDWIASTTGYLLCKSGYGGRLVRSPVGSDRSSYSAAWWPRRRRSLSYVEIMGRLLVPSPTTAPLLPRDSSGLVMIGRRLVPHPGGRALQLARIGSPRFRALDDCCRA